MDMRELEQLIARAEYVVDVDAVVDAILRRMEVGEAVVSPGRADGLTAPVGPPRHSG